MREGTDVEAARREEIEAIDKLGKVRYNLELEIANLEERKERIARLAEPLIAEHARLTAQKDEVSAALRKELEELQRARAQTKIDEADRELGKGVRAVFDAFWGARKRYY